MVSDAHFTIQAADSVEARRVQSGVVTLNFRELDCGKSAGRVDDSVIQSGESFALSRRPINGAGASNGRLRRLQATNQDMSHTPNR